MFNSITVAGLTRSQVFCSLLTSQCSYLTCRCKTIPILIHKLLQQKYRRPAQTDVDVSNVNYSRRQFSLAGFFDYVYINQSGVLWTHSKHAWLVCRVWLNYISSAVGLAVGQNPKTIHYTACKTITNPYYCILTNGKKNTAT